MRQGQKKYQVVLKREATRMGFQVTRFNQSGTISQWYHCEVQEDQMHPSLLQLFGSFSHFCNYLHQHPHIVSFDEYQLCLALCFDILGENRYLYLDVHTEHLQQTLASRQIQLIAERGAIQLHSELFSTQMTNKFNHAHLQAQQYTQWWQDAVKNYKKEEAKLHSLEQQILKLTNTSTVLDCKLTPHLHGPELQQHIKRQQQQQQKIFWSQIEKAKHNLLQQLQDKPIESVTELDLSSCQLKTMRFVCMFTFLKQIRLGSNMINRIQGLNQLQFIGQQCGNYRGTRSQRQTQDTHPTQQPYQHSQEHFPSEQLQILSLSHNFLITIPKEIGMLNQLIEIRIVSNQVSSLPVELRDLKKLAVFAVFGNPCFSNSHNSRVIINWLVQTRKVHTMCLNPL